MCRKQKGLHNRIDKCMKLLIKMLNRKGFDTKASCCGHSKYPMTIVVKSFTSDNNYYELLSRKTIPRSRKFYVKDKQGYYYIPEVMEKK